ncbi:MAG: uroporphyrinogen decarboxylase [Planctomycetes bacterium]|nr:uroporphyrinogen decarboxylase [Planctomycetota bacterium]
MSQEATARLRIASFESRRSAEMERLIERHGGLPLVSPSMREVPLDDNPDAVEFAHRLMAGQVDVVVLLTGVGLRHLVAQVERRVDRQRFLEALSDVTTVVRGPKPLSVMREFGIEPTVRVPEPNTWRELLKTIDRDVPVAELNVVVQEYGLPNVSLIAGLEARGARVRSIKVYHWELPVDTAPLEANLRALVAGQVDVAMFTSAHQVANVLRMAEQLGLAEPVHEALQRVVVASIGPTTSDMLRECELPVDLEPEHGKMGQLVIAVAERGPALVAAKRGPTRVTVASKPSGKTEHGGKPAWHDSPFMKACRLEPVDRQPVWLMRQAGRYMAEYRAVREQVSFLELCKNPHLCADVMLTAVELLDVDAAIIFSDLLPMLEPMGIDLEFAHGEGPVIHNPIRSADDIERFHELEDLDQLEFVFETVRLTRAGLRADIPVIGFAGAPFTLASYVIEGSGSRSYTATKTLMYREPAAWHELMGRLARSIGRYLNAQLEAGAQCVQIFDSWVGCLDPDDYRNFVLPHTKTVLDSLPKNAPSIHFGTGNPSLLPVMREAGGTVIGIDWRVRLDEAWKTVGYDRAVQGNLEPAALLAEIPEIRRRAREVLRQAAGRPGHIFNLGHGVLQQTSFDHARALIDAVHEFGPQRGG